MVDKLEKISIRLCLCTATCIATDFVFIGITIPSSVPKNSYTFIPICDSINMVINILALLLSYADYKNRLFPFKTQNKSTKSIKYFDYPLQKVAQLQVVS